MKFRTHKYNAKPTIIDGHRFASGKEGNRYRELKLMERAGLISELQLQVNYPLEVNGQKVSTYRADFVYVENGKTICEDVKGMVLDVYRLKRKMLKAQYGIEILET